MAQTRRCSSNGSMLMNAWCLICSGECLSCVWFLICQHRLLRRFCCMFSLNRRYFRTAKILCVCTGPFVDMCKWICLCVCIDLCLSVCVRRHPALLRWKMSVDQINRKLFDRYNPCFHFPSLSPQHFHLFALQTRASCLYIIIFAYFFFCSIHWFIDFFWKCFFFRRSNFGSIHSIYREPPRLFFLSLDSSDFICVFATFFRKKKKPFDLWDFNIFSCYFSFKMVKKKFNGTKRKKWDRAINSIKPFTDQPRL